MNAGKGGEIRGVQKCVGENFYWKAGNKLLGEAEGCRGNGQMSESVARCRHYSVKHEQKNWRGRGSESSHQSGASTLK